MTDLLSNLGPLMVGIVAIIVIAGFVRIVRNAINDARLDAEMEREE